MDCKECEHYQRKTCIWNYDYLDTDYAYDCCDFIHKKKLSPKIYIFGDKKYKKERKRKEKMRYELSVSMLAWHFHDQTKYRIYFYYDDSQKLEIVEEGTFASMYEKMANDDISYAFSRIFAWKVPKDGLVEIYIEPQKKHSETRLSRLH